MRPLTKATIQRRLEAICREIGVLGAAYDMSNGALRHRLLLLQREFQELLRRWR